MARPSRWCSASPPAPSPRFWSRNWRLRRVAATLVSEPFHSVGKCHIIAAGNGIGRAIMTMTRGFAIGALALAVLGGLRQARRAERARRRLQSAPDLRALPCPRPSTAIARPTARRGRITGRTAPTTRSPPRSIPRAPTLSGDETITYTNNSPVALDRAVGAAGREYLHARMRAPAIAAGEFAPRRAADHRRLCARRGGDRRRQPGGEGRYRRLRHAHAGAPARSR